MELQLDRKLSNRRVYPSIDVPASGLMQRRFVDERRRIATCLDSPKVHGRHELNRGHGILQSKMKGTATTRSSWFRWTGKGKNLVQYIRGATAPFLCPRLTKSPAIAGLWWRRELNPRHKDFQSFVSTNWATSPWKRALGKVVFGVTKVDKMVSMQILKLQIG